MCSTSVLCPLCAQASFNSIDDLRNCLIKIANGPLPCPVCNELFLGLDKLTIHLFSHTTLMMNANTTTTITTTAIATEKAPNMNELKNMSKTSKSPTQPEASKTLTNINETITMEKKPNKKGKEKKAAGIVNNKSNPKQNLSNVLEQLSSCDICELTFRNGELRDMHFNLVHHNSKNLTATCQQSLISDSPTKLAVENDFKCHLCVKTYKTKGSLRVHLKVVHMLGLVNMNNNTTKLNICDRIRHKEMKVLKSNVPNQKTEDHSTSNHNQSQFQPVVLVQTTNTLTLTPTSSTHQNAMLLTTKVPTKAENHLTMSTERINENLMQSCDGNALNSNFLLMYTPSAGEFGKNAVNKAAIDNPKIWECDVCSKLFTTKYFLKKHKRLHTGEMPYTCEICARTFTFQQSYHKHLLYHSDDKPHTCATCGRAFKEVSTLHNHERIHSGEKPFKCEICGKCFRQRVSFLVHTRIHTGQMPYKCEHCEKNFRYKVSLRTHKCARTNEKSGEIVEKNAQYQQSSSQFKNTVAKNVILNEQTEKIFSDSDSPESMEIAVINSANNASCVEALLSKTIDDIVVESCKKLGIGNENNGGNNASVSIVNSSAALNDLNEGSSSPLLKLQEMRLYSPKFGIETPHENSGEFDQIFYK